MTGTSVKKALPRWPPEGGWVGKNAPPGGGGGDSSTQMPGCVCVGGLKMYPF